MTDDKGELPLIVLVGDPSVSGGEIYDENAALHMAIVERQHVAGLDDDKWENPGAYILLDRVDPATGTWGAYAGKAAAGIKTRMKAHVSKKEHWYRALLIRRDTTYGFNSAQAAWLEGRLYDLLVVAEYAQLHNGNRPVDETLPDFERLALERVILPIERVLILLGHDPTPVNTDEKTSGSQKSQKYKYFGVTVKEMIDDGVLEPGTIESTSPLWTGEAILNCDGTITYDGQVYQSLSAAGGALQVASGGPKSNPNGWDFWAVATTGGVVKLSVFRERYIAAKEASTSK